MGQTTSAFNEKLKNDKLLQEQWKPIEEYLDTARQILQRELSYQVKKGQLPSHFLPVRNQPCDWDGRFSQNEIYVSFSDVRREAVLDPASIQQCIEERLNWKFGRGDSVNIISKVINADITQELTDAQAKHEESFFRNFYFVGVGDDKRVYRIDVKVHLLMHGVKTGGSQVAAVYCVCASQLVYDTDEEIHKFMKWRFAKLDNQDQVEAVYKKIIARQQ